MIYSTPDPRVRPRTCQVCGRVVIVDSSREVTDMCPDCQHPYSVHGHGGEGENAYPVCPPEIRDEMAEVIESAVDEDLPADPTRAELQAACVRAADAILPIIEREKADAWDEGFRAGDGYGTSCTETHAGYRDSLPIRPANPYRGEGE